MSGGSIKICRVIFVLTAIALGTTSALSDPKLPTNPIVLKVPDGLAIATRSDSNNRVLYVWGKTAIEIQRDGRVLGDLGLRFANLPSVGSTVSLLLYQKSHPDVVIDDVQLYQLKNDCTNEQHKLIDPRARLQDPNQFDNIDQTKYLLVADGQYTKCAH